MHKLITCKPSQVPITPGWGIYNHHPLSYRRTYCSHKVVTHPCTNRAQSSLTWLIIWWEPVRNMWLVCNISNGYYIYMYNDIHILLRVYGSLLILYSEANNGSMCRSYKAMQGLAPNEDIYIYHPTCLDLLSGEYAMQLCYIVSAHTLWWGLWQAILI